MGKRLSGSLSEVEAELSVNPISLWLPCGLLSGSLSELFQCP